MTLSEFLSAYKYDGGRVVLDGWRELELGQTGDCEDFVWTVLCVIEGDPWKALRSGRAEIHRVWGDKNKWFARHLALWHEDYGWIESDNRKWDFHLGYKLSYQIPMWLSRLAVWTGRSFQWLPSADGRKTNWGGAPKL